MSKFSKTETKARRFDNPDRFRIDARKDITYGRIKADRLARKNERRTANGLPPLESYHLI